MTYYLFAILDDLAMQDTLHNAHILGASPAELSHDVESGRDLTHADHEGCPELRLWEDGFSVL